MFSYFKCNFRIPIEILWISGGYCNIKIHKISCEIQNRLSNIMFEIQIIFLTTIFKWKIWISTEILQYFNWNSKNTNFCRSNCICFKFSNFNSKNIKYDYFHLKFVNFHFHFTKYSGKSLKFVKICNFRLKFKISNRN